MERARLEEQLRESVLQRKNCEMQADGFTAQVVNMACASCAVNMCVLAEHSFRFDVIQEGVAPGVGIHSIHLNVQSVVEHSARSDRCSHPDCDTQTVIGDFHIGQVRRRQYI